MRLALVSILLGLLTACAQPARTEYHYLPPQSPDKLACVDRCYQTDRDCLGSLTTEPAPLPAGPAKTETPIDPEKAKADYEECSKRVQAEYEQCETTARSRGGRGNCYRPVCVVQPGVLPVATTGAASNDAAACSRIFRGCFERCGGKIETREVCEGNCY